MSGDVGIGDDFVVLRTLTVDTTGSATGESPTEITDPNHEGNHATYQINIFNVPYEGIGTL